MGSGSEIPLPVSPCCKFPFRAIREANGIRFESTRYADQVNLLGFGIWVVLLALAAAGYLYFFFLARSGLGREVEWPFHAIVIPSGALILLAIARQRWIARNLRACTISRRGDGILELRYAWRNGKHRTHRLKPPATFLFLLRQDSEGHHSWQDTSDGGAERLEAFQDTVSFDLILREKAAGTRIQLWKGRWLNIVPTMYCYFKEHRYEANRAAAVEAGIPLAEAVLSALEIPVVFHQSGGRKLRRLEPGDPFPSQKI